MLKIDSGLWCSDDCRLREKAKTFYCQLYTSYMEHGKDWHLRGGFPLLDNHDIERLAHNIDNDEIKDAVFEMGPLKSPCVDGIPALFFQKHWDSIKKPLLRMIKNIFNGGEFDASICKTMIVLIPKNDKPESFNHFRPISLCNMVYKIITKVIANRMKSIMGKIISPMQSSFVPGRHIIDNIVITQEVIHSMERMKGNDRYMAIKVDLEKAYDRLDWGFILDTLMDVGIPGFLVNVIMKYLSSTSLQVSWNGSLSTSFKPSQGVRQGDPFSP